MNTMNENLRPSRAEAAADEAALAPVDYAALARRRRDARIVREYYAENKQPDPWANFLATGEL